MSLAVLDLLAGKGRRELREQRVSLETRECKVHTCMHASMSMGVVEYLDREAF